MYPNTSVCVIGVGFVGEHLLAAFMKHYPTSGLDISHKRILKLRKLFPNTIFRTDYNNGIAEHNVFLISVPTLVSDEGEIDMSYLHDVKFKLLPIIKPGSLVVIESSVYIGATREIFSEFIDKGVYVGFSPERVDPGRVSPSIHEIPKIVAGINNESLQRMKDVYGRVFQSIVPVSSLECAEMSKLYENCFRMVNIAYVNEIADMCYQMGIDTHEMISASSTKPFGFMSFHPGLGVGGHCIPVNPYYLMYSNQNLSALPVLSLSTEQMKARPKKRVLEIANLHNPDSVLVVGVGFKKGESLTTNSPGYEVYKEFLNHASNVSIYDPIVQNAQHPYMSCDKFHSSFLFDADTLKQMYDMIIVCHSLTESESAIVREYYQRGGDVYYY